MIDRKELWEKLYIKGERRKDKVYNGRKKREKDRKCIEERKRV